MKSILCILLALGVFGYGEACGDDNKHISTRQLNRSLLLIADTLSSDLPSAAYERFLTLQRQRKWSEMYDLMDRASQVRMEYETKAVLLQLAPNEEAKRRIRSISGRDLWIITQETATHHPRKILSEKVTGNLAILRTETIMEGRKVRVNTYMIKEDGVWKVSFPADDQPLDKEFVD